MSVLRVSVISLMIAACGGNTQPAQAPAAQPTSAEHAEHAEHGEPAEHAEHGHGPAPIGHRFGDADAWVARFEGPDRDAWQQPAEVVSLLALDPGMRVADIGAGTGYFVQHLSPAVGEGGQVLALDIEPDMVRFVGERAEREGWGNVDARVVATDDPGLAAGSVDRVLIVNTWHHIPEREAYAAKLARALAPGGAVYIVDFTMESRHGPPRHHRLEPQAVIDELTAGGLEAELVAEPLTEQYVVVGRAP